MRRKYEHNGKDVWITTTHNGAFCTASLDVPQQEINDADGVQDPNTYEIVSMSQGGAPEAVRRLLAKLGEATE